MTSLVFHCKVVTPMFLGGASSAITDLRPPSLKGALRFWWRAINGDQPLSELREKERSIFGGTKGETANRSSFSISIPMSTLNNSRQLAYFPVPTRIKGQVRDINVLEYLAYGTYDWDREDRQNILNRDFIEPPQSFQLVLRFFDTQYQDEILKALKALAYFGGLGAKSRNGYGSIGIQDARFEGADYLAFFKTLRTGVKKNHTAFSESAHLFETAEHRSPEKAHGHLGEAYKYARENVETRHFTDKRMYIASPLKGDRSPDSFLERHAKNFLMSIIALPNGNCKGLICYLPYQYLNDSGDVLADFLSKSRLRSRADAQTKYDNAARDFITQLNMNLTQIV